MLDPLFFPKSIAIIGASGNPLSIGNRILKNLLAYRFTGTLYPVNPKAPEIEGLKAYPSVLEIPGEIDLVHIILRNTLVCDTLRTCREKGVKVAIVNSAGFRETGEEGVRLEEELVKVGKECGIRIFGPNCQGVINTDPSVSLYSNFTFARVTPGNISILAQGGGVAEVINNAFSERGIGTRMYASNGNACDISIPEILAYFGKDPQTRVIVLHVESLDQPAEFLRVTREITRGKPILAIKSGSTREGAMAVSSHTGGLMEADTTSDILLAKAGIVRLDTVEELCEAGIAFACEPLPKGDRLGIVTNAGSPAILATDEAVKRGLKMPPLSEASAASLRERLKGFAAVRNPIDMAATANPDEFSASIQALLGDENMDSVLVCFITPFFADCEGIAREIARLHETAQKPMAVCVMTNPNWGATVKILKDAGLPVYDFPENAARALRAMETYRGLRDPELGEVRVFEARKDEASSLLAKAKKEKRVFLTGAESFRLLECYGIPFSPMETGFGEEQVKAAGRRIGFPVVLKVDSEEGVHKTERGGVALDLKNEKELLNAFYTMRKEFAAIEPRFLVQRQISGGIETILGAVKAEGLGHSIMFGLGGIFVEVLRDVSFRLTPLTEGEAREMIAERRAAKLLRGHRGRAPADCEALIEILQRLSQLLTHHPAIQELDLNPVIVQGEGQGAVAVDARIRIGEVTEPAR